MKKYWKFMSLAILITAGLNSTIVYASSNTFTPQLTEEEYQILLDKGFDSDYIKASDRVSIEKMLSVTEPLIKGTQHFKTVTHYAPTIRPYALMQAGNEYTVIDNEEYILDEEEYNRQVNSLSTSTATPRAADVIGKTETNYKTMNYNIANIGNNTYRVAVDAIWSTIPYKKLNDFLMFVNTNTTTTYSWFFSAQLYSNSSTGDLNLNANTWSGSGAQYVDNIKGSKGIAEENILSEIYGWHYSKPIGGWFGLVSNPKQLKMIFAFDATNFNPNSKYAFVYLHQITAISNISQVIKMEASQINSSTPSIVPAAAGSTINTLLNFFSRQTYVIN